MKLRLIKGLFVSIIACVVFAGCLKDKDFDNGSIQSVHTNGSTPQVIEIRLTALNTSNFFILAVDNSTSDTTVDLVPINLATASPASQDIHVTVSLDSTLVDAYDTANATDYAAPSSNMYTIANPVVTISKGSNTGYVQIKFKPSNFIGADWALGFRITAIQESGYTISGNLSTGITAISVKNQYDGVYNAFGYFVHPSVGGPFNTNTTLFTSGPNSVDMANGQPYSSGTLGVYPRLTVGAAIANGVYAVTVTDPTASLPLFTAPVEAGYVNKYDANVKTFYINYGYTTSAPREATDTLVYIGPR